MPRPIFVLGKHRSGTTWIANQLCQHSLIAGVTHERHEGIHESAYFSWIYNRYGDLAVPNNFMEFVEVMSASDYFRLAGVDKAFLYSLWPTTYEDVFRTVMDDYAMRQGATFWIEKSPSHTILADKIAALYPDAKFIAIVRDAEAVVASMIARETGIIRSRPRFIVTVVLSRALYHKSLQSFSTQNPERVQIVRYEDLRSDLASTMQQICAFLQIPFERRMCEEGFVPNTSFQKRRREQVMSDSERKLVRATQYLFELVPSFALKLAHRLTKEDNGRTLPPWFFKLHPFSEGLRQSAEPLQPLQAISRQTTETGKF